MCIIRLYTYSTTTTQPPLSPSSHYTTHTTNTYHISDEILDFCMNLSNPNPSGSGGSGGGGSSVLVCELNKSVEVMVNEFIHHINQQ